MLLITHNTTQHGLVSQSQTPQNLELSQSGTRVHTHTHTHTHIELHIRLKETSQV